MADDLIRRSDVLNPYLEFSLPRGARHLVTDTLIAFLDYVKRIPSVDAVEVTRCRDCKYALDDDSDPTRFWCSYKWPAFMVPDNGFCFRGEAKDG